MITIRKHMSAVSLLPTRVKFAKETVPIAAQKAVCKNIVMTDGALTAGMRRILEQYRAGTYCSDDYSTRTCQRHRKLFLEMGIDLRAPYRHRPSASPSPSVPELRTRQRAKPLCATKTVMKRQPEPESVAASELSICRKSKSVSHVVAREHRTRAQQRRRVGVTSALGAMARLTR